MKNAIFAFLLFAGIVLLLGYQNCQQGGSALGVLPSKDCPSGQVCGSAAILDQDRIKVTTDDSYGVINVQRGQSSLFVTGTCNTGGYDSARVTATLKRLGSATPSPETLSADCLNKRWSVTFNRLGEFGSTLGYADLNLDAGIVAFDEYGDIVSPSYTSNGQDTSTVKFSGTYTEPTPPPNVADRTISIANFRRHPSNNKWLTIDAYIYPPPTTSTADILMVATRVGADRTYTITKTFTGVAPSSGGYWPLWLAPGNGSGCANNACQDVDNFLNASDDLVMKSYNVTLSIVSTQYSDTAPHRPFPDPYPIVSAQRVSCNIVASANGPAQSVTLRLGLLPESSVTSFPLEYEFRNLTQKSGWTKYTTNVTLNGENEALVSLTNGTAYRDLTLFRFSYRGALKVIVSDCR